MTSTYSPRSTGGVSRVRSIIAAVIGIVPVVAHAGATPEGLKEGALYFWGVQRSDGSSDTAATNAVRQRLLQVGASMRSFPGQLAGLSCIGAQCPEKLADSDSFAGIPVVGAYLDTPASEGDAKVESAILWWLDTSVNKLYRRRLVCQGQPCLLADRLAREAVFLVEQGPAAVAAACSSAPPSEATSEPAAAPPPPSPGLLSAGISLSLTTTHGAKAQTRSLLPELQNGLLQLGIRTTLANASFGSAAAAQGGTRLFIELQGSPEEKKPVSAIQTVFLALSAPGVSRQMRLYCSPESCGRDLSHFLRVNISALLDGAEPEPRELAVPCAQPAPTTGQVASRSSAPLLLAPAATVSLQGGGPEKPPKPQVNLGLCAAGWTLVAAGLGGAAAAGIVAAFDDQLVDGICIETNTNNRVPCRQRTLDIAKIVAGISGGILAVGGVLVGVASYRSGIEGFRCIRK